MNILYDHQVFQAQRFGGISGFNASPLPKVAGGAAIYYDPSNLESMIYAMEEVAYSTETNRALGSAGPLREAQFSWDHCARETVAIYGK